MSSVIPTVVTVFLTFLTFFLCKQPATAPFRTQLTFISLFALLFYVYFTEKNKTAVKETRISVFLLTIFILFLVGSTGWFNSPFSFTIYFLVIVFSFIFTPIVSIFFIISLIYIIYATFGRSYDQFSRAFFIIISLIASIPITFYLRQKYLQLREESKDIYILKKKQNSFIGNLDDILENRINFFSARLRQPISTIRNFAFRLGNIEEKEKKEKAQQVIIASADEALQILNKFEEELTGRRIITKENKSSPLPPTGQE